MHTHSIWCGCCGTEPSGLWWRFPKIVVKDNIECIRLAKLLSLSHFMHNKTINVLQISEQNVSQPKANATGYTNYNVFESVAMPNNIRLILNIRLEYVSAMKFRIVLFSQHTCIVCRKCNDFRERKRKADFTMLCEPFRSQWIYNVLISWNIVANCTI